MQALLAAPSRQVAAVSDECAGESSMVTKKSASSTGPAPESGPAPEAGEAARNNIWLAGLGAFAKAQAEGTKAFEALVNEGVALQRKTHAMAQERISEATQQMEELAARASNVATDRWDKLEGIFEQRVARALARLGIPSAADLESLSERLDTLERAMRSAAKAPAKTPASSATKAPARPAQKKTK